MSEVQVKLELPVCDLDELPGVVSVRFGYVDNVVAITIETSNMTSVVTADMGEFIQFIDTLSSLFNVVGRRRFHGP